MNSFKSHLPHVKITDKINSIPQKKLYNLKLENPVPALSVGLRPSTKGVFSLWHYTASDGKHPVLENMECPLHCHYSKIHWCEIEVSIRVPFMGQIDMFKNYLYLVEILDAIWLNYLY